VSHPVPALGRRIVRGMVVILFFGLFARFGGFLINVLIAGHYGPGRVLDAFSEVFNVIVFTLIYSTVLKVFVPAFMPLFAEVREREDEERAWHFANTALNLLLLGGAAVVVISAALAPQIVATLVPGFSSEAQAGAVALLRGMAPGVMAFLFAAAALGVLNSYKVFSYPSAGEAVQKLVWAGAFFAIARLGGGAAARDSTQPIVLGFLIGCAAQVGVLFLGLRPQLPLYSPSFPALSVGRLCREILLGLAFVAVFVGWTLVLRNATRLPFLGDTALAKYLASHASLAILTGGLALVCLYAAWLWQRARRRGGVMARFAVLAAPLLLGVVFARYRDLTTALYQSRTWEGGFGILEAGKKVANLAPGLVAYSLSIAMFPFLCDLAARRDTASFGDLLGRTLRTIALFFAPLTVAMMLLGRPLFQLFFDRGGWQDHFLFYGGLAVAVHASALVFYAMENVLMQAFFSIQRMWTPTLLGALFVLVHAGFLVFAIDGLGFRAPDEVFIVVALSFPLTRALKNILLLLILHRRVPVVPLRQTAVFLGKLAVVCVGVAVGMLIARAVVVPLAAPERFNRREVVLDTFEAEARGWFSPDVMKVGVAPAPGFEGNALAVRYEGRGGRHVAFQRDLTEFRLRGVEVVSLRLAAAIEEPTAREVGSEASLTDLRRPPLLFRVILEVAEEQRPIWGVLPVAGHGVVEALRVPVPVGSTATSVKLSLSALETGVSSFSRSRPVRLRIEDANDWKGRRGLVRLFVDDVYVRADGRDILIDNFDAGTAWEGINGQAACLASLPSDGDEMTLRVAGGPHRLVRDISAYDLRGCTHFEFKAAATHPLRLRLNFTRRGKPSGLAEAEIAASSERRPYRIRLAAGDGAVAWDPESDRMEITVPSDYQGRLWLDNIAFVRPGQRVSFEVAKALVVIVPCLAAFVCFVGFAVLLRVEEARAVWHWLRAKGWRQRDELPKSAAPPPGASDMALT